MTSKLLPAIALLVLAVLPAQAASITWTAHNITNDVTNVSTAGTLVDAPSGFTTDRAVNGVTFESVANSGNLFDSLFSSLFSGGAGQYGIGLFVADATTQSLNVRTRTNLTTTPALTSQDHFSKGWQIRGLGPAASAPTPNAMTRASVPWAVAGSCIRTILLAATAFQLAAADAPQLKHFPPDPPDMPAYSLPEPLLTNDGHKVASADDWRQIRRPEVLELFRKHVYGRVPDTAFRQSFRIVREDPLAMGGAATLRQVEIRIEAREKSLVIHLTLFVPNKRTGPAPAFLLISNRGAQNIDPTRGTRSGFWPAEEGIARGYAMAAFQNADIDPDKDDGFKDGIHGILDGATRPPDAWGTIAAWAWGASRCLDYLVTDKDIAKDKVAVIGHSRGGKTALWAAAEDERFAMACSNDSGCGGAALSRRRKPDKETVGRINKSFPHWFNTNFKSYNDRVDELPVDQHMLIALIAPRAVCVGSASQDLWADPRGEFESALRAGPVYRLLGKSGLGNSSDMPGLDSARDGDGLHYHIRAGKHDLTPADWGFYMDFADKQRRK